MHTYSISDLARELDITTRAIRFYEEQGMLSPGRHGQERVYSGKDRVALKLILRGKRIGFSLAECKSLIELYDPASGNQKQLQTMLEKLSEQRAKLEQQMLDIQQMQLELETAEERCRAALTQSLARQKEKTGPAKRAAKTAAKRAGGRSAPTSKSNK